MKYLGKTTFFNKIYNGQHAFFSLSRYGKTVKSSRTSNAVVRSLEVKKSRFLDFYVFGSALTTFLTATCIRVNLLLQIDILSSVDLKQFFFNFQTYLFEIEVPTYFTNLLDTSCAPRRSGKWRSSYTHPSRQNLAYPLCSRVY